MKKTQKELAEFYGITTGDIVTIYNENGGVFGVFECRDLEAQCPLKVIECEDTSLHSMEIGCIRSRGYKVSKPKKKVGETKCEDYEVCLMCPLCILNCRLNCNDDVQDESWSLYQVLNEVCYKVNMKSDNPIYKAFRAELDKEVE